MYVLKDWYNDGIVAQEDDLETLKVKAREYDEACEGDWGPVCYESTPAGKIQITLNFKY